MILGQVSTTIHSSNDAFLKLLATADQLFNWCLSLSALEREVINQIDLYDEFGRAIGSISIITGHENFYSNNVYKKIKISQRTVEYWSSYLLKYLRDSVAEVDHVDVDADLIGEEGQARSLILSVDKFVSPMSADDMNKILGI